MNKQLSLLFAALFLSLQALAAATPPMIRHTTEHEGVAREYFVHVPQHLPAGEPVPLVLALHGYGSTATGFEAYHGLAAVADRHGFMIAYPQGSYFPDERSPGQPALVTSWNDLASNQPPKQAGPHCTPDSVRYPRPPECSEFSRCAWTSCNDDLGLLEKILDELQADYPVDAGRVYLLGVSNGGMMALSLGCKLSGRFAAMSSIIAQLAPGYDCGPESDLPMLHLAGARDNSVRIDGQPGGDGFIYTSRDATLATWAAAMSCSSGPQAWSSELSDAIGMECIAYSGCNRATHEVVSCVDPLGGHVWPAQRVAGVPATCVSQAQFSSLPAQPHCPEPGGESDQRGMELVWQFFSRYHK